MVLSDFGELQVMQDLFVDEDYAVDAVGHPSTILDVGANIGLSVLYFRARYPDAVIYAVEPHPESVRKLRCNLASVRDVHILESAVGRQDGTLELFDAPGYSIGVSAHPERDGGRRVAVPVRRLESVMSDVGLEWVDLLKLDIERGGVRCPVAIPRSRSARVPWSVSCTSAGQVDGGRFLAPAQGVRRRSPRSLAVGVRVRGAEPKPRLKHSPPLDPYNRHTANQSPERAGCGTTTVDRARQPDTTRTE